MKLLKPGILILPLLLLLAQKGGSQTVENVFFTGNFTVGSVLTGYYDATGVGTDSLARLWYRTDPRTLVASDTGEYKIQPSDLGKKIYFKVMIIENDLPSHDTLAADSSAVSLTIADNKFPAASGISIIGNMRSGLTVFGTYTYSDYEDDPQGTSVYQWYVASDITGTDSAVISGATSISYQVPLTYINKYLKFSVKPVASSGTLNGVVTGTAAWYGPVQNDAPTASGIGINGNLRSGMTVYGTYSYSDTENNPQGTSVYQWYVASDINGTDSAVISGATSISYLIPHIYRTKFLKFSVKPVASSGTLNGTVTGTAAWYGPVLNDVPVAGSVSISGPATRNVNDVLTGVYSYSDTEGDLEQASAYVWLRSPDGNIASAVPITSATGISYKLALADTGKYIFFRVTPKAATGNSPGSDVTSAVTGPVNTPPYVVNVVITGTLTVGSTLTGTYQYHDGDNDLEKTNSNYKWYRGSNVILNATGRTYQLTDADEGKYIRFEVAPVSQTGYPDTGPVVLSPARGPVVDATPTVPIASEVCIEGTRAAGQELKGRYYYYYPTKAEGDSKYRWLRNNIAISGATDSVYTLTAADISSNEEITFEVTPWTSHATPKVGAPANSDPLARITLLADSYSIADAPVTLTANVSSGLKVFSGPGVVSGVFDPKLAGTTAGTPHTIRLNYFLTNTHTTCSQEATKSVSVLSTSAYFDGFNNVYCHDGVHDTIVVRNVPPTATDILFQLTDNDAFVKLISPNTIVIDPHKMRPGTNKDTLFFTYTDAGSKFPIFRSFIVDSVSTSITLVNLNSEYCEGSPKRYVTVEGLFPFGGTGTWTGLLMTDKTTNSAFIDPSLGTPAGSPYPVTYQYESPYHCKSALIPRSVTLNPLPDSDFDLSATYNINGGPKVLSTNTSGGSFVGAGMAGNTFYPDIAGQGSHEIKYFITDAKGCSSNTPHTTIVRKVEGKFNGIPSIICYKDTTFSITTTDLPSGITIVDFTNTKNGLINVPGTSSATYNVKNAGSGFDTLRLKYIWDAVEYTLAKSLYTDSIGKIAITGIKDNYCDYESMVSLRVFVENSTGFGNFSFSGPDSAFVNYGNIADFYPEKTPTSALPYTVTYTHVSSVYNSGCVKKSTNEVTVNKAPVVDIITSRTTVNLEEPPFVLEGSPSGGIFSGKGIYKQGADYVFNPLVAGVGNIDILLSYVDSKGCYSSDNEIFVVSQAVGSIDGIDASAQYCIDGPVDNLSYSGPAHLFGVFSGNGITNTGPDMATFNPALAGRGEHNIVFTYFDLMATPFNLTALLKVDSIGQVTINNLKPGDIFCNNDAPFQMFTSHQGGVFTGPVDENMLDPSLGSGDEDVTYIYTNSKTGCSSSVTVPVLINPAPVVAFEPADYCIESVTNDTTGFINNTISSDAVTDWLWEFYDLGISSTSKLEEPGFLFKTSGPHKVVLTATTNKNCAETREEIVDLGIKPKADFYWLNECYHPADSIQLRDTTIFVSTITSRTWDFFDGDSVRTVKNPKYPKNAPGYLTVKYVVRTNYLNCHDSITKSVYVRPTVSLAADDYFENFESGNGGWVKDEVSKNSWVFGTPSRPVINSAFSGAGSWFTNYSLSGQTPENSSVISPCFDMTTMHRPMIVMQLWKRFDRNRDGAALQYKIGDEREWNYVGTLDDGINWYNSTLIKGKPGGEQVGWTAGTNNSKDAGWAESRHTLDELKGKKDVKLRIVYGSDGTSTENDGIAFDDIKIEERTRGVLLEHFTNASTLSAISGLANTLVNDISYNMPDDIVNIQYHTNFPGSDPYYSDNPGDANARFLLYGLSRAPFTITDGGTVYEKFARAYPHSPVAELETYDIIRRSMINPLFEIDLNTTSSGGILDIGGEIKALQDVTTDNITLYIAVTERENSQHPLAGEPVFYNVFRKFIPDAAGISLKKTWTKDETFTIPGKTWTMEKIPNSSDISVIVFLQNNITKEVYQAKSDTLKDVIVGIEDLFASEGQGFGLYPNPAVRNLTLVFKEPLTGITDIRIYDFSGTVVKSYKAGSDGTDFIIEDLSLKNGIYLVRVSSGGRDFGYKKLIISGK